MYYVYILQSVEKHRHYIGSCKDVVTRLKQHNSGSTRSTRAYRPWRMIYTECYPNKELALAREKQIKSYKGGRAFKALLESDSQGEVA